MPRKQYPSDQNRLKFPPHVRVSIDIRKTHPDHPDHALVFADPLMRGIWLGIHVIAAENRAYAENGRVILSPADLRWITGRSSSRRQRELALECARLLEHPARELAAGLLLEVENPLQNQGVLYALRSGLRRTPPALSSDHPTQNSSPESPGEHATPGPLSDPIASALHSLRASALRARQRDLPLSDRSGERGAVRRIGDRSGEGE